MNRIEQISELLNQVPRPPEDPIPSGVTDEEIAQFEDRTAIIVPAMLRSWLRVTNGPCVGPGGFYGIRPLRSHLDIEESLKQYPDWSKRQWIPVAGDGCGHHYIIPTQNEFGLGYPVLFIDVGMAVDSPSYVVASDLEHFIVGILRKEIGDTGWPFRRTNTLTFDPQLLGYHGVPFPWVDSDA
jgi:hypothetical protein